MLLAPLLALSATPRLVPILSPIGVSEIVWNKIADACPQTKPDPTTGEPKLCEEPDSVPIAWHNPLSNSTFLLSSTDCNFAGVGATLSAARGRHQCGASPFVAAREAAPWTYNNHQWLQSARVFQNGTGFAMIHNEFHGEQRSTHNASWCSTTTNMGHCSDWSTDMATTVDGGATWQLAPLRPTIALPRQYRKDGEIAGYGAIGQVVRGEDGYFYGHVARTYHNNTGAGPANTAAQGTCVFRTRDPGDPASLRGWNGSAWSTQWVNPYVEATPADELWRRTCADVGGVATARHPGHFHAKKFAGALASIEGWPTHVLTGLGGEKTFYFFPDAAGAAGGAAPFTSWEGGATVDVEEWLDPCTVGASKFKWMYPNLLDDDSPFGLAQQGNADAMSEGLSYGLVGNHSLYLYSVMSRQFIVRLPVAWFLPGQPLPRGPFQPPSAPPPTNPVNCTALDVHGAPLPGVDGRYSVTAKPPAADGTREYKKDANHTIYHYAGVWKLAHKGVVVYYPAPRDLPRQGGGVPKTWGACLNISVSCACSDEVLRRPSRLRADGLVAAAPSSCALGVSTHPVFTAVIDGAAQGAQDLPAGLRFVISHRNATVVWDSGFVSPGAASGVACGGALRPGTSYLLRAQWKASDGRVSLAAAGCFTTALATEADWRGAAWVGAGHGEFAANFSIAAAAVQPCIGAKIAGTAFLSAPGGAQLLVNGQLVGDDAGVAPWLDWTKAMHHHVVDVSSLLRVGVNRITLLTGCGAWCPSLAPTWAHSGRAIRTPAGAQPMARLLLLAECDIATETYSLGALASGGAGFSSRIGSVLSSSSWFGSTMDYTLPTTAGWQTPARLVPQATLQQDVPALMLPILQPPIVSDKSLTPPAEITKLNGSSWVFRFDQMIVGTAVVLPSAVAGSADSPGRITLEFCEVLLPGDELNQGGTKCVRQKGFEANGTVDTYLVHGSSAALRPLFTWRGFRYVIVTAQGGARFRGELGDIGAKWSAIDLEKTAQISFGDDIGSDVSDGDVGGGDDDAVMAAISAMIDRTQRSNLVSGFPSDCPTREKHGWLGDATSVASFQLLNYNAVPIHRLFLQTIADAQASGSAAVDGFVPVVVPCHQGVDAAANDLSWTSGFVLITRWLSLYWGEHGLVGKHFEQLKRWTDGQLRNSSAPDLIQISTDISFDTVAPAPPCPDGYFAYGAGEASFNGCYNTSGEGTFTLDKSHVLYQEANVWRIGEPGVKLTYVAKSATAGGPPLAASGWTCKSGCPPPKLSTKLPPPSPPPPGPAPSPGPHVPAYPGPDYATYGDLGYIVGNTTPPSWIRMYVARSVASLNFLLALEAMVDMAIVVNSSTSIGDATRWNTTLQQLRSDYAHAYWSASTGSFAPGGNEGNEGLQTMNALAISAKVGTAEQRASAGAAMVKDVASRGYALSVGAVGTRTLLDVLSDLGSAGHDAAVRLVVRKEFPGWGYMAFTANASTCWEGWNKYRPTKYQGSHNHAWLCGGVGEWMYSRLGGIVPTSDGFETLTIEPRISKSFGPATISMKLLTLRGVVWSNWTRHTVLASSSRLATVSVEVPLLTAASRVVLPLLGHAARDVRVTLATTMGAFAAGTTVWEPNHENHGEAAGRLESATPTVSCTARLALAVDGAEQLQIDLPLPGRYSFAIEVHRRRGSVTLPTPTGGEATI